MPTLVEVLPATRSSPHGAVNWTPHPGRPGCGVLVVHTSRASVAYAVAEFSTPWAGRAFRLEKRDAGTDTESDFYDVFVGDDPRQTRCCCKGFAFARGTPRCKHTTGIIALLENGWL